jgi:hypothetical protein
MLSDRRSHSPHTHPPTIDNFMIITTNIVDIIIIITINIVDIIIITISIMLCSV